MPANPGTTLTAKYCYSGIHSKTIPQTTRNVRERGEGAEMVPRGMTQFSYEGEGKGKGGHLKYKILCPPRELSNPKCCS